MTVADIRRRKQAERLKGLHQQASLVLAKQPGGSLWLFGSWARGNGQHVHIRQAIPVAPGPGAEQPEAAAGMFGQHEACLLMQPFEPLGLLAAADVSNRDAHASTL